jgi:hypothetical protein
MTDGQLLECCITRRDDAAFEALVRRTHAATEPIRLLDLATGQEIRKFPGHKGGVAMPISLPVAASHR